MNLVLPLLKVKTSEIELFFLVVFVFNLKDRFELSVPLSVGRNQILLNNFFFFLFLYC